MLELWILVFINYTLYFTSNLEERTFKINIIILIILILFRLIRKEHLQKK